jgi:hypothetical protein
MTGPVCRAVDDTTHDDRFVHHPKCAAGPEPGLWYRPTFGGDRPVIRGARRGRPPRGHVVVSWPAAGR